MKESLLEFGLDETDIAILQIVQRDSRISNSELARRINLSQPATHTRLKRLRTLGVIRQHVSLLDPEKLGLDMICFVNIRLQAHSEGNRSAPPFPISCLRQAQATNRSLSLSKAVPGAGGAERLPLRYRLTIFRRQLWTCRKCWNVIT